jgi:hypothetical protein
MRVTSRRFDRRSAVAFSFATASAILVLAAGCSGEHPASAGGSPTTTAIQGGSEDLDAYGAAVLEWGDRLSYALNDISSFALDPQGIESFMNSDPSTLAVAMPALETLRHCSVDLDLLPDTPERFVGMQLKLEAACVHYGHVSDLFLRATQTADYVDSLGFMTDGLGELQAGNTAMDDATAELNTSG